MLMDEAALLGYGSNGTMVFKGTWDGQQVRACVLRVRVRVERMGSHKCVES
eukprot:COSAG01_NODE_4327_length_5128_cov_23.227833_3_plen_51_part_00